MTEAEVETPPPAPSGVSAGEVRQLARRIEQAKQQGVYALAATLGVVALVSGYLLIREGTPKPPEPPPLADPFQIVQTEQKETIKLDRRTGEFWVIEDGVEVSQQLEFVGSRSLLDDKFYTWDRTDDGSKMTVRLKYSGRKAYCVWRIWPAAPVTQKLATAARLDPIRVEFYDRAGTRLFSILRLWTQVGWVNDGKEQFLEWQGYEPCSAANFRDIATCRVWY